MLEGFDRGDDRGIEGISDGRLDRPLVDVAVCNVVEGQFMGAYPDSASNVGHMEERISEVAQSHGVGRWWK